MSEELDSQLSAMFDDELPEAQCELLARRLARDEMLKARWGRYATIRAAMHADESAHLTDSVAVKVRRSLAAEAAFPAAEAPARASSRNSGSRWWYPVAGTAVAGIVAAVSVFWLRQQSPIEQPLTAQVANSDVVNESAIATDARNAAASSEAATPDPYLAVSSSEPDSYTVPTMGGQSSAIVPSAELANYVVAHSEFSSPMSRRNLLSALVASDSGIAGESRESDERSQDSNADAQAPSP